MCKGGRKKFVIWADSLSYVKVGERSLLYELRLSYMCKGGRKKFVIWAESLSYVKVGERSLLYELRAYLIYVKVGEKGSETYSSCICQHMQQDKGGLTKTLPKVAKPNFRELHLGPVVQSIVSS